MFTRRALAAALSPSGPFVSGEPSRPADAAAGVPGGLLAHPVRLLLFGLLSLADLFLTLRLLAHSGAVYESNPLARWWLARHGWLGLACFKAATVLVVVGLAGAITRRRPRAGGRVLGFACAALALVVCYSSVLYGMVHTRAAEEGEVARLV